MSRGERGGKSSPTLSPTRAISDRPVNDSCSAGLNGSFRPYRKDRDFERAMDRAIATNQPLPNPIPRQDLNAGDSSRGALDTELKRK